MTILVLIGGGNCDTRRKPSTC